jgi:hypothetical protein
MGVSNLFSQDIVSYDQKEPWRWKYIIISISVFLLGRISTPQQSDIFWPGDS